MTKFRGKNLQSSRLLQGPREVVSEAEVTFHDYGIMSFYSV